MCYFSVNEQKRYGEWPRSFTAEHIFDLERDHFFARALIDLCDPLGNLE